MNNVENKEQNLIQTNPKKAIKVLAVPIMISLIFAMLNNVIDSAWVSGLGPMHLQQ